MTNKQIIIDGVDVGECKHYEDHTLYDCNETCEINGGIICTKCKDNPNCYYKQLKTKEQECDQLKQAIARVKELIQKEINDCEHRDDCTSCEYNCCIRQAMQICNEVTSE